MNLPHSKIRATDTQKKEEAKTGTTKVDLAVLFSPFLSPILVLLQLRAEGKLSCQRREGGIECSITIIIACNLHRFLSGGRNVVAKHEYIHLILCAFQAQPYRSPKRASARADARTPAAGTTALCTRFELNTVTDCAACGVKVKDRACGILVERSL